MKNRKLNSLLAGVAIFVALFLSGCNKFEEPPLIFNPDEKLPSELTVTGIIPQDSAVAGVRDITITGSGFTSGDTVLVFVNGEPAFIKSVTDDQIVINRPTKSGTVFFSVSVPTDAVVAQIEDYSISKAIEPWGDFKFQSYDLSCVEIGPDESMYVATRRQIFKLAPDGIVINNILGDDGARYGSDFSDITDMKFGPGGYLFACLGEREIYRIDLNNNGAEEEYARVGSRVEKLDFDQNGNLYAARRDGIYVVNPGGNIIETGIMDGTEAVEIRVINNQLYYASETEIVKFNIEDNNGNLAANSQQVVDIEGISGFLNCAITSFTMDVNSTLILCIKNHPTHSIFIQETDGSIKPYYEADILPTSTNEIVYGNGKYLYLNEGSLAPDTTRMYRMGMEFSGAQYLGRQL